MSAVTFFLGACAIAALATAGFFAYLLDKAQREARTERSELITRIQRPEWIPPTSSPVIEPYDPPEDEFGLVGSVILGDGPDADN